MHDVLCPFCDPEYPLPDDPRTRLAHYAGHLDGALANLRMSATDSRYHLNRIDRIREAMRPLEDNR